MFTAKILSIFTAGLLILGSIPSYAKEMDSTTIGEMITDSAITEKVKERFLMEKLFGDRPIAVWTIHVGTKEGTVYLSGTAENEAQIENAKKIAKDVKGVKAVESTVKIEAKKENGNGTKVDNKTKTCD